MRRAVAASRPRSLAQPTKIASEERFDAALRTVAKHKPTPEGAALERLKDTVEGAEPKSATRRAGKAKP
jgi:hypothetical protein